MNKEKVTRIARDLGTLTMPEAMLVVGTLMQEYGLTVAGSVVQMLQAAVDHPQEALSAVQGKLKLVSYGDSCKIPVIKALRAHYKLGLKEAKTLADEVPVVLEGKKFHLGAIAKQEAARALIAAGATVEFF